MCFFFNLENNCFQSRENHQLSTNIRKLAQLFSHDVFLVTKSKMEAVFLIIRF